MHGNGLITVAEAAALVGRPVKTVFGWVHAGHLAVARRVPRRGNRPLAMVRVGAVRRVAAQMARRGKRVRAALATVAPPVLASQLRLPAVPTDTRPGSEDRVRVYEARVKRGEALFHPEDATLANSGDGEALVFGEVA